MKKFMSPFLFALLLTSQALASGPREFRAQLNFDPISLDPATAEDAVSIKVLANVMEGLLGYDGAGKLRNNLAESYEISKDRKRYTFTLRPQARWSDDKPVTAEQFVLGLRRALDPKNASTQAPLLFCIRGARQAYSGKAPLDKIGVRADGGKVVFELEKPAAYFLHVLTLSQAAPAREDILSANGGRWPDAGPSTGPYRIVSRKHDQEIRLEANPHYWNPKGTRLPVLFRIVTDEGTGVNLLESGGIDILMKVPPLDVPRLKQKGLLREDPQLATIYLSFNAKKPPFNDKDFRRAVSGVIDRAQLVTVLGTSDKPAIGWAPPGVEGAVPYRDPVPIFRASMERVREKLKKSPVTGVVAAFNQSQINSAIMEKIQQDLKARLGLDVELQQSDWKSHTKAIRTDPPSIFRYGRSDSIMDAYWHFVTYKSDDPNNATGWKSAEYDKLVDAISSTPSGPARVKVMEKAQKLLVEDEAIVVPLYYMNQIDAVAKRVKNFRVNPVNAVLFEELALEE